MPPLERRRNILEDFAAEFALLISLLPDFSLNIFQRGGFPVLVHQPANVSDGCGRPRRRVVAPAHVLFMLALEIGQVAMLDELGGVPPAEREENVMEQP